MSKLRPKPQDTAPIAPQVTSPSQGSTQASEVLEAWQSVLARLKERSFESVDEVVGIVIAEVSPQATPEEAEFLRTLIETDPEMMDALRSVARIGKM